MDMHTDTLDRAALIAQLVDDAELAAKHLEERREDDDAAKAWRLAGELRAASARADITGVEVQGVVYVNLPSRGRSVRAMVNLDGHMDLEGAMQSAFAEPMNLSLDWRSFLGDDKRGGER
jgi:hypothetical protein